MRHRALVYALEPVEVVGLAVACAFLLCGRRGGALCGRGDGVGVARRGCVASALASTTWTRDSSFRRSCRTRALLLDAIRAGQVVLEDVRAARLAGLRMGAARLHLCVFASAFLRADGSRAANRGDAWFHSPRISIRIAQRINTCAASLNRTRRLTFLRAGSGQTTSSSSAIALKCPQRVDVRTQLNRSLCSGESSSTARRNSPRAQACLMPSS